MPDPRKIPADDGARERRGPTPRDGERRDQRRDGPPRGDGSSAAGMDAARDGAPDVGKPHVAAQHTPAAAPREADAEAGGSTVQAEPSYVDAARADPGAGSSTTGSLWGIVAVILLAGAVLVWLVS